MSVQRATHASWRHQLDCIAFVLKLFARGRRGAMIAMDPGTGKSKTAIEIIQELMPALVLIVCPMRVIDVWKYQLSQHAGFSYLFCGLDERAGSVAKKADKARSAIELARVAGKVCVIAINYESVWLEPFASLAMHTAWPLIIADECHRLKQASGKCSRFMGYLAAHAGYRLGLTGTPLPHTKLDLWAQFRFIDRNIYNQTYSSYKMHYGVWGGYQGRALTGWRFEQEWRTLFASITFRVSKDVLDLPPEMDQVLYTDLSPKGRRHYNELEANFLTWLGETPQELITVKNALVLLMRLQQLTGGTLKDDLDEEHQVDTSKESLLADWLEDQPSEEPIIIFARFRADLAAIGRACKRSGATYSEISGSSPHGIAPWQAGNVQVLAAQIQLASEGQDFTRARYCVFYSMGFRLFEYIQARARVHRAGQKRPTTYFHLLCRDTVDEKVLRAVQNRWEIVETVLEEMKHNATGNAILRR